MPLNTAIERDGEALQLRWSDFHVAAMICAAAWDSGKGPWEDNTEPEMQHSLKKNSKTEIDEESPFAHYIMPSDAWQLAMYPVIGQTPLNDGAYTLKRNYTFVDCSDGEVLNLEPGDKLKMYRTHK